MTFEEMQTEIASIMGEPVERPLAEHEGWQFGERVRATEGDEDEGLYAGDVGLLIIETVGSPAYGNERVAFSLLVDGYDSPVSIESWNIEST